MFAVLCVTLRSLHAYKHVNLSPSRTRRFFPLSISVPFECETRSNRNVFPPDWLKVSDRRESNCAHLYSTHLRFLEAYCVIHFICYSKLSESGSNIILQFVFSEVKSEDGRQESAFDCDSITVFDVLLIILPVSFEFISFHLFHPFHTTLFPTIPENFLTHISIFRKPRYTKAGVPPRTKRNENLTFEKEKKTCRPRFATILCGAAENETKR